MKITRSRDCGLLENGNNRKLHFESGNQLLYGANEVGKSTLYQFIQAMLFGFSHKGQKKNAITHLKKWWFVWWSFVVGTSCVWGSSSRGVLKKNKGQAIIYYQQQMGMKKTLQQMLHPLTKKLFQEVFLLFQQEQLITSDKLTEEELQTSLLAIGVSGSQQLLTYRNTYF